MNLLVGLCDVHIQLYCGLALFLLQFIFLVSKYVIFTLKQRKMKLKQRLKLIQVAFIDRFLIFVNWD